MVTFRSATGTLILLTASLLVSGCLVTQKTAGTFELVVRDAQTGQELRDCLLVTVLNRTETDVTGIMGGGWESTYNRKEARIRRVNSGDRVEEPLIFRPFIPLGLIWVTNYAFYGHYVFCRGYCPVRFGTDQNVKQEGPLDIAMDQERPGEAASDGKVLFIIRDTVRFVLPAIPESDPLRDELARLIKSQLQGILAASKDRVHLQSAQGWMKLIDERYLRQDAGN